MNMSAGNTRATALKLPVFAVTPPRLPASMPVQRVSYWTLRAVTAATLRGMAEGMAPRRVLRRAAIPVTHNDQ
jgi:hypothetical protein